MLPLLSSPMCTSTSALARWTEPRPGGTWSSTTTTLVHLDPSTAGHALGTTVGRVARIARVGRIVRVGWAAFAERRQAATSRGGPGRQPERRHLPRPPRQAQGPRELEDPSRGAGYRGLRPRRGETRLQRGGGR